MGDDLSSDFPEYSPRRGDLDGLLGEGCVVFDTSALIDAYGLPTDLRLKFLVVLERLHGLERLWLPHQVALEYHYRKQETVDRLGFYYDELAKQLDRQNSEPSLNIGNEADKLRGLLAEAAKEARRLRKADRHGFNEQRFSQRLESAFSGCVGPAYDDSAYERVVADAEWRYRAGIPPGFEDRGKESGAGNPYGDYVLWRQTLDFAAVDGRPIILISNDSKRDWVVTSKPRKGAPRPELVREMRSKAGVDFHRLSLFDFLTMVGAQLEVEVSGEEVEKAREAQDEISTWGAWSSAFRPLGDLGEQDVRSFLVFLQRHLSSSWGVSDPGQQAQVDELERLWRQQSTDPPGSSAHEQPESPDESSEDDDEPEDDEPEDDS